MLDNANICITGGTGSLGNALTRHILANYKPNKLVILSRDEFKQSEMRKKFPHDCLRFFLGDIRDRDRLVRAFSGLDYILHAAAYKQVPLLEYNPTEAVKTNVIGAMNVIEAAIDCGVKKTVFISSDKAVNAVNIYGATKFTAERLFIAANSYSGHKSIFSCVRYGNIIGSRGSVIPLFQKLAKEDRPITITDERMTRFWLTYDEAVELILFAFRESVGGEIFVPKCPSMRIVDVAKAVCPDCKIEFTGIRPGGEKIHETLISTNDARNLKWYEDYFVIIPEAHKKEALDKYTESISITDYTSDKCEELKSLPSVESTPVAI